MMVNTNAKAAYKTINLNNRISVGVALRALINSVIVNFEKYTTPITQAVKIAINTLPINNFFLILVE